MDDKLMSPDASPSEVRRLSSRPLVLAYIAVALITGVIIHVVVRKFHPEVAAADAEPEPRVSGGESPRQIAARLVQERAAQLAATPPAAASPSAEPEVLVATVDEPPRPPGGGRAHANAPLAAAIDDEDEQRKERLTALHRALSGTTAVQLGGGRTSSNAQTTVAAELERVQRERASISDPVEPLVAYQQALQAAAAASGIGGPAVAMPPPVLPPGPRAPGNYATGGPDRFRLDAELEPPRGRFIIQPGSVIPAVLDSAVNSELPGELFAHIAVDVYDSPTGRHLLLPQGAKLFGTYASGVVFGQARLMIAWQRITLPDGRTLNIGEMPGADGLGRAGFTDLVDNHYFRIFGSALLLSGVTAGVALSQDVGGGNSQRLTAGSAMSQAIGQQLGQVTAQFLQKNMNVSPTLDVRAGYRFNVIVTKDIVFRGPYRRQPV